MNLTARSRWSPARGSGIGSAIALLFAKQGASVVVADVNEASAIAHDARESRATRSRSRPTSPTTTRSRAMVQHRGRRASAASTARCNNAGIAPDAKPFIEHTLAEWQRTIDVDLTGVFLCMQHELRQLVAQGRGGAIVNISSAAGIVPAPGQPQYTAAKHGVLGLTKQAAQEFAGSGIRVNAVLPGQTETDPMRAYLDALPDGRADAAPPADGPHGDPRRDRADRRVAVLRRRVLRERRLAPRRRRPHRPLTGATRTSPRSDSISGPWGLEMCWSRS